MKLLFLVFLGWSCIASAISLGPPKLLSSPNEPLRVEIPILVNAEEQSSVATLQAAMPAKAAYDRLGVSSKVLDFNVQTMVYQNRQGQLVVMVETAKPIPVDDDPFIGLLVNLTWSSGSITKAFTLLMGDAQKILVRSGQTMSEIAAQMVPQLDGATLDQTMMALFKANPDAFASGSINRIEAGAELNIPTQALLRSISPAEAKHFVSKSNAQWRSEREAKTALTEPLRLAKKEENIPAKDRLKIGSSSTGDANERRDTEELVAQEKMLEQAKVRVVELEKNIADLQKLLGKSKGPSQEKKTIETILGLGEFTPAILALFVIACIGLLLWFLAKNARKSEIADFVKTTSPPEVAVQDLSVFHSNMPERAKALFAGIDLDLTSTKPAHIPVEVPIDESNSSADTLRVKLNLARAYITIEDFSAAKKSLEDILQVSNSVDPSITAEAQELLLELSYLNG